LAGRRRLGQGREALSREGRVLVKMVTGPDNIDVSRYQFHLAAAQREQGRHEDAIVTLRRACETVQRDFGADHPRMARALEKLALQLSAAGNESEAVTIGKQAQ